MSRHQVHIDFTKRVYPDKVYVRGVSIESLKDLQQQLKLQMTPNRPRQVSTEVSQQLQEDLKDEALLSLFVYKPKQTGVAAVAEMTASAINNPDRTSILIMEPGDEATADERIDREEVLETLKQTQAFVTTDPDDVVEHLNGMADDGMEIPVVTI